MRFRIKKPIKNDFSRSALIVMKHAAMGFAFIMMMPLCVCASSEQDRLAAYIKARGYCIIDLNSGRVVAAKNLHVQVPVASTTKMVTALAARTLVSGNPPVTVTKEAAAVGGARAGIKEGEIFAFNDLLSAMLVRSANDVASAVAVSSAGSRKKFVAEMNRWCIAHGLKKSSFADPAGLSAGSVSTPYELAMITKEFFNVPEFDSITKLDRYTLISSGGRSIQLKGLNVLHAVMPEDEFSVCGKTGFTAKAKYCFAGIVATKKGKWLITVTGADSTWRETYMLIKYCEGELELPE